MDGRYGAYMVDGESSPFYVVQWAGKPWRAEKDDEEDLDGHTYKWRKGDYLCRGSWLDKLYGKSWYTMDKTHRECIVKFEHVINASLDLRSNTERSGDNPLSPLQEAGKARVKADGAWRLSDMDNIWLTEESRLRGDNFEYDAEEANKVLYQERVDEQWKSMGGYDSEGKSDNECS